MHMIVRYPSGRRADALMLAGTPETMRIILHHRNESLELRKRDGYWLSDAGKRLVIEAVFAIA
jgi:hypothetical protein